MPNVPLRFIHATFIKVPYTYAKWDLKVETYWPIVRDRQGMNVQHTVRYAHYPYEDRGLGIAHCQVYLCISVRYRQTGIISNRSSHGSIHHLNSDEKNKQYELLRLR